ncbi:MAG TPA: GNAT family N-acetyltransferase [Coleofasciculaceae cyanobacterium]|jgi:predicted GNAT family N-acyltransferase
MNKNYHPQKQIAVELIAYGSREYQQACQLRYELFFAEHGLPWDVVLDEHHAEYFHAAILIQDYVVAYGQLVPHSSQIYQICQMVVKPNYQGQNLGRQILFTLIKIAKQEKAIAITLNARLTAVGFYQNLGFQTCGAQFPSTTTGVIHIQMNKKL